MWNWSIIFKYLLTTFLYNSIKFIILYEYVIAKESLISALKEAEDRWATYFQHPISSYVVTMSFTRITLKFIFIVSLLTKVIAAKFSWVLKQKRTRQLHSLLTIVYWLEKKIQLFFAIVVRKKIAKIRIIHLSFIQKYL